MVFPSLCEHSFAVWPRSHILSAYIPQCLGQLKHLCARDTLSDVRGERVASRDFEEPTDVPIHRELILVAAAFCGHHGLSAGGAADPSLLVARQHNMTRGAARRAIRRVRRAFLRPCPPPRQPPRSDAESSTRPLIRRHITCLDGQVKSLRVLLALGGAVARRRLLSAQMRSWGCLLIVCVAACASSKSAPSAPHVETVAGDAPSRDEVVAYARRYIGLSWVARPDHVFHGLDRRGTRVDTPDEHYLRNGWKLGENVGVPYCWGGFDTPEQFLRKLDGDWPAGHAVRTRSDRASWYTAGIDCSGLISRSWGLPRKYTTREFPTIAARLVHATDLLPGDILDKPDGHAMLFESFTDTARTQVRVVEAGAWNGRAWRVVESDYPVEQLEADGFVPLRDARRSL